MQTLLLRFFLATALSWSSSQGPPDPQPSPAKRQAQDAQKKDEAGGVNAPAQQSPAAPGDTPTNATQLRTTGGDGGKQPPGDERHNTDCWMVFLTFCVVAVGGIQAWILKRQTEIINRTLVLGNRARLAVRDVTLNDDKRLINYRQIPGGPSSEPLSGSVLTVNIGGTDAYLVEEYSEIIFRHTGAPLRVGDNRFHGRPLGHVRLPPGMNTRGIGFSTSAGDPILDTVLLNRIRERELEVFLLGWVGYRDELGNYRQTSYCRKWDLESMRFIGTSDPDYENAD